MYMIMVVLVSVEAFGIGYLGYQTYINYKYKRGIKKFDTVREQLRIEREKHTKEFKQIKKEGNK